MTPELYYQVLTTTFYSEDLTFTEVYGFKRLEDLSDDERADFFVWAINHIERLQLKVDKITENNPEKGACACAYDTPEDVCGAHFPNKFWEES